ncbi:hypothetical protein [Rhodococcus sp. 1168]|uniref:hypothetical protein n=1 Tax=Rhodococcus sp. 1168 TaxID=2018041 RepID=UPI000F73C645|nr:hypothetical protein [Rhodococcus sp. 1168]
MTGTCPAHLPLKQLVSAPRYNKYRDYATQVLKVPEHEADSKASRLYTWNASVAAAYMPSIAFTEVIMRNSINSTICAHFGVAPAVGWHTLVDCNDRVPPWNTSGSYTEPPLKLTTRDVDELINGFNKIKRRFQRQSERVHDLPNGDDMVGGSSLGSWLTLIDKGEVRDSALNYHDNIWIPYLQNAFPGFTGKRGTLLNQLREFQELRNKCAHHEPVLKNTEWHRKKVALIIKLTGYVNAGASRYIDDAQQIGYVVDQRPSYLAGECYL